MTNIAMENPNHKWRFIAGKIIYFYGPWLSMAMLVITRLGNSHELIQTNGASSPPQLPLSLQEIPLKNIPHLSMSPAAFTSWFTTIYANVDKQYLPDTYSLAGMYCIDYVQKPTMDG